MIGKGWPLWITLTLMAGVFSVRSSSLVALVLFVLFGIMAVLASVRGLFTNPTR